MPNMRIPQYIERNTHLVKLQQVLAYAKNEETSVYREGYTLGKFTTLLAYAKNEDTFVYRLESTFRKITQILLSLCQIKDASVYS